MKFRVKRKSNGRYYIQTRRFFIWVDVPTMNPLDSRGFEYRETAEEYRQWLESNV